MGLYTVLPAAVTQSTAVQQICVPIVVFAFSTIA
jgi:hypothetical protein